jgi:hypothetical protein
MQIISQGHLIRRFTFPVTGQSLSFADLPQRTGNVSYEAHKQSDAPWRPKESS